MATKFLDSDFIIVNLNNNKKLRFNLDRIPDGGEVTINLNKNGTITLGAGDMSKSIYDTNNDGVIDRAEVSDSIFDPSDPNAGYTAQDLVSVLGNHGADIASHTTSISGHTTDITNINGDILDLINSLATKVNLSGSNTISATNTLSGTNTFTNSLSVNHNLKLTRGTISAAGTLGSNTYYASTGAGGYTITLPSVNSGRILFITKESSGIGTHTISGHINGSSPATIGLTSNYDFAILLSNGTTWIKLLTRIGGLISEN